MRRDGRGRCRRSGPRPGARRAWGAAVAALWAALGAAAVGNGASAEPPYGSVAVEVRGVRNGSGVLRAKLVAAAEGFPASDVHVVAKQRHPIRGERVRFTFHRVRYGEYALVVLHDEDGDGALARGWQGLPAEGLAFSSGARIRFGPPSFEDARFALDRPRVELELELRY